MARETVSTSPPQTRAAPRPSAGRRLSRVPRRWRAAAVLGVAMGLMAAGLSALPRPGIPPAAWVPAGGGQATGAVAVRYRASPLHRVLMGPGYREVWATPIRAPVLGLDSVSELRPSGGRQTRGMRMRGPDGREYAFRSLDKDQSRALAPLPRLLMGRFRQDQVSALHPGATLVAAGLQDAAGVLNATPSLVVFPAIEGSGGSGGLLPGTLQLHPENGFAGAERVVSTDSLWAELRRAPGDRVDARAYLTARLMDVLMGDWDRHEGQLRWARMRRGGAGEWVVIPRDRDYAFSDYRGVIPGLARRVDPKIVRFDAEYRDLPGLLVKSRALDRRLLCGVPASAWDSTAAATARALSDSVIAGAMGRMPREWITRSTPLAATLFVRRDRLPDAARRFRQHLHANGGCTAQR